MQMSRLQAVGAALLMTLIATACGSASSPSSEASSAGSVAGTEPSADQTAQRSAGEPTSGPVADLEALIPDQIGGIPLTKSSMNGEQFVNSGSSSQELQAFLRGLGVSIGDVSIAVGVGFSQEAAVAMFVFQAQGADTDRLVSGFKEAYNADSAQGLVWQPASIAGKQVERTTNPQQPNQVIYLYAKDDVLYFLTTATEEQAAEALAGLP